ncbi:MAG: cation:proton antiporter, partial [Bdellovibrionales bacterium]|nr:cation:proton antiporter [Bdellovibrionales bacterium]
MHGSFLKDIALVLGVAALTSTITYKFRLPSVLGYLIAGFIIGPYIPIPLFADPHRVESLSEFGVILVMFSIGMEFSLAKFFRVLPTSGVTAALEVGAMFMVGISLGYVFEWTTTQSIFMGGALAISSTMIVSKVFEEHHPKEKTREHVLGVLVIQDVVAILLLTVLGAFAASNQLSFASLVPTVTKLIFILALLTIAGLFIVPKFIKYVSALKNTEVLIIVATGLCFVLALIVENLGYSVALGAFLAGILVAESGEGSKIEHLAKPLKDVFVAIFFVSVGMTVDPLVAITVLPQSVLVSVVVVVSQFFIVFMGSILSGTGLSRALFSSLALGQIGEFSFIIAAIGAGAGMVSKEFQAIIVTVAILTSLLTPLLWRHSELIVNKVSQKLPNQFRIAIGLYEAWFRRLRENKLQDGKLLGVPKRVIIGLFFDSVLLILIPPLFFNFLPPILNKVGVPSGTLWES